MSKSVSNNEACVINRYVRQALMADLLAVLNINVVYAATDFISEYRSNADFRKPIDSLYSVFLILGRWRESRTLKPLGNDVVKMICEYALFNNTIPNKQNSKQYTICAHTLT